MFYQDKLEFFRKCWNQKFLTGFTPFRDKSLTGFTLAEFIIYIAIIGIISVPMVGFLWSLVFGNLKTTTLQEIQENGRFGSIKMFQETKKARAILNPLPGNYDMTLSLLMEEPTLNPTIFDVFEGKLRIIQGTNPPYELTSDLLFVKNLKFTNLSYPGAPTPLDVYYLTGQGTVRIEMEIEPRSFGPLLEVHKPLILKSTVSLRPSIPPF